MNKLLVVLFSVITSISLAQDCIYDKNETDKFSKKKLLTTKREKVFGTLNTSGYYSLKRDDESYSIIFDYTVIESSILGNSNSSSKVSIKEKDQLMLLLENDEIITLEAANSVKPSKKELVGTDVSNWAIDNVIYPITKEQLESLRSNKILTLRIFRTIGLTDKSPGEQEHFDVEIKKRNQTDIQKMIDCILQ
jgi:hypothetical protein